MADKVFPHFIAHVLPVGISGLVVSALFAVAMSSLDSGVNSVATVLTVDLFSQLNPQLTKTQELQLARKLTLIVGLMDAKRQYVIGGMAGSGTGVSFNAARCICNRILGADGEPDDYPPEYFSPARLLDPEHHTWPAVDGTCL